MANVFIDIVFSLYRDPQIQIPFVQALFAGGPFLSSIPNALSDEGILVAQVGESPSIVDAPEHLTLHRNRATFSRTLAELGFQVIRDYEEVRKIVELNSIDLDLRALMPCCVFFRPEAVSSSRGNSSFLSNH